MLDAKVALLHLRKRFCNRRVIGLLAFGLIWLLIPPSVHAADLRSGERIMIDRNTVIDDDLYLSAETVEVDGVVHGDLFAVGNRITIRGEVQGSVVACGGNILIEGQIGCAARAAGGEVRFGASSRVGGDVIAAGKTLVLAGAVGRDAVLGAGHVELLGSIAGKSRAGVEQLLIGEAARLGAVVYHSAQDANVAASAKVASLERRELPQKPHKIFGLGWLLAALAAFTTGAVLVKLVPAGSADVSLRMRTQWVASLGWGLALLFATPLASFLVMLTVLGLPLGGMALLLYAVALYLGYVAAAFALGEWLLLMRNKEKSSPYASLAIGIGSLALLSRLPVMGGLLSFAAVVMGLGALWLAILHSSWFALTFRRPAAH